MTGFININKETGVSSAFIVNRVKRLAKTPAGHMGTLDPLASGVLPVAIGNACRLFGIEPLIVQGEEREGVMLPPPVDVIGKLL